MKRKGSWRVVVWEKREKYTQRVFYKRPNSEKVAQELFQNITLVPNQIIYLINRNLIVNKRN